MKWRCKGAEEHAVLYRSPGHILRAYEDGGGSRRAAISTSISRLCMFDSLVKVRRSEICNYKMLWFIVRSTYGWGFVKSQP